MRPRQEQAPTPPESWYKMLEKIAVKIESLGGEVANPRYICSDCTQVLYWLNLAQFYCGLSTTS